jgi:hypothetical protein
MKNAAVSKSCKPLFLVLLTALLALAGTLEAKSSVSPERALADARAITAIFPQWSLYRADGISMAPRFDENHLLLVEEVSGQQIRPGMVALFRDAEGDLVAHSVIENDGITLATRGLNNRSMDPARIQYEDVVGVLVGTLAANAPFSDHHELQVALGKTY